MPHPTLTPPVAIESHEPPSGAAAVNFARRVLGTPTGWAMRLAYLLCDVFAFAVSVVAAKLVANIVAGSIFAGFDFVELKLLACLALGSLLVAIHERSYAALPPRPVRHFRGWTIGVYLVGTGLVVAHSLLVGFDLAMSTLLFVATALIHVVSTFVRALCRIRFGDRRWWGTQVVIVGSNERAQYAMRTFFREPQWGVRPIGFVTEEFDDPENVDHPWNLGAVESLDRIADAHGVRRAVVALHDLDFESINRDLVRGCSSIRQWFVLPTSGRTPSLWMEVNQVARLPALTFSNHLANPRNLKLKRVFDFLVALACALILLPVILALALMVRLTSPGPTFYFQNRIGRGGKTFKAWKFRSMRQDADEVLKDYLDQHPELKAEWEATHKLKNDPRVTTVGKFLRFTSLDELPQLWNVLVGDMSLVGPRPIVDDEIEKYGDDYFYYTNVTPGITGLWQVSGRNNTSYEERVSLDCYYAENWSLWLDVYILACTVRVVLRREGAY